MEITTIHKRVIGLDVHQNKISAYALIEQPDGISPHAYGEEPLRPEWQGDPIRDAYELELLHEFMEARKPVLEICRGMQLINIAMGGSLCQDLPTQMTSTVVHESQDYTH